MLVMADSISEFKGEAVTKTRDFKVCTLKVCSSSGAAQLRMLGLIFMAHLILEFLKVKKSYLKIYKQIVLAFEKDSVGSKRQAINFFFFIHTTGHFGW